MRLSRTIIFSAVVVLFGSGACIAQATKPAAPADAAKQAMSKTCSDQANAKGLHGKERKKFRSACKKNGGKEG